MKCLGKIDARRAWEKRVEVIRCVRGCRFWCIEPGAFELGLDAFSDGSINLLAYGIFYGFSCVGYFDVSLFGGKRDSMRKGVR